MTDEESRFVAVMRQWLLDNVWGDRPGSQVWVPLAPPDVVLRGITRHYPGGIAGYVNDTLGVST